MLTEARPCSLPPRRIKGESDKIPIPRSSTPGEQESKVSLADRVAIYDLFARYSQAIDMGNGDEMVNNVFAPEGIFHDPSLCPRRQRRIRAGLTNHPSHVRNSEHWPNNIVITEMSPKADRAMVHSYVFLVGPKGVGVVGTYHDTLVKVPGQSGIENPRP